MKKYIFPEMKINRFNRIVTAEASYIAPLTQWQDNDENKSLVQINLEDMKIII